MNEVLAGVDQVELGGGRVAAALDGLQTLDEDGDGVVDVVTLVDEVRLRRRVAVRPVGRVRRGHQLSRGRRSLSRGILGLEIKHWMNITAYRIHSI